MTQPSDMVERVARAIWETRSPVIPFGDLNDAETKNDLCSVAAAALEASHHAELVSVLHELVYGGGGHVWAHARELLAKIGGRA